MVGFHYSSHDQEEESNDIFFKIKGKKKKSCVHRDSVK